MAKEIIYVGDPLCGWCYGFSDIFEKIIEKYQNTAKISIVMGGLKVEDSIHINKKVKKMIAKNWAAVMDKTGQKFSIDQVDKLPDGKYNSEPPCRAVVTMRHLKPGSELPFYKALHKSMYIQTLNNTDPLLFCELAQKFGVSGDVFNRHFNSKEMKARTQIDFEFSRASGVLGFPAFVLKDNEETFVLNQGYKPYAMIEKGIEGWLKGERSIIF